MGRTPKPDTDVCDTATDDRPTIDVPHGSSSHGMGAPT
jgi:hypothetical protein